MLRHKQGVLIFLSLAGLHGWLCPGGGSTALAAPVALSAPRPQQPAGLPAPRAHLAKGQHALETKNYKEARAQFELAIQADPKLAEAYLGLGYLELQAGDATAAIQQFRKAVELSPESFQGHYYLAMVLLRQQKLSEGAQELERAVAIDPRQADGLYNLGVVLLELGRPEEALDRLRQAREKGSKRPDIAFNLVRAELAADRTEEARQEAASAARIFGGDSAWRRAVAQLFLQYKLPRDAAVHLAEAARLEPGSEEIRRQLAGAHLDAGDATSALALLRLQREPKTTTFRPALISCNTAWLRRTGNRVSP